MNKNKKYVMLFFGALALISLVTAWIMSGHLNEDISQERYRLTKKYKKLKDETYNYKPQLGALLYKNQCARCHGKSAEGSLTAPPLAGSQILLNEQDKLLKIIVKGLKGPIERNGKTYNSTMPSFKMIQEEDLAHVVNYIRQNFGNQAKELIPALEFNKMKVDTLTKKGMYLESELTDQN